MFNYHHSSILKNMENTKQNYRMVGGGGGL